MKKILSLALVVLLIAACVPMAVFAAPPNHILGFSKNADMLDSRYVEDFGSIIMNRNKNVLDIPIYWEEFTTDTGLIDKDYITQEVMDNLTLHFEGDNGQGNILFDIHKEHNTTDHVAKFVLTPRNIGSIDAFLYLKYDPNEGDSAVCTSARIPIKGVLLDPTITAKIDYIKDKTLDALQIKIDGKIVPQADFDKALGVIRPGTEITFMLDTSYFQWDPDLNYTNSFVRRSTLTDNHIDVIKDVAAGKQLIKEVVIENIDNRAHVVVRFEEFFNKVEPMDFDFSISLAQKGVRNRNTTVYLAGSLENDIIEISEDNDYAFIGDGTVAEAIANCRNIRLDLDNGVILKMNLSDGKKYYGRATDELTDDDRALLEAYPEVRKALTIRSHNIKPIGDEVVTFDLDKNYFVYDKNGKLLGKSTDSVPFRDKYYLADKEIILNIDPDDQDAEIIYDGEEDVFADNPPTGANSLLNIVGGIGFVTILTGGALVLKKKNSRKEEN